MIRRLHQLRTLKIHGFAKTYSILYDYLTGRLSNNILGYVSLRFLKFVYSISPAIFICLAFALLLLGYYIFCFILVIFALVTFKNFMIGQNILLNKNICSSLPNLHDFVDDSEIISINNKFVRRIAYSNPTGTRLIIRVEFKKKSYALKNANLFKFLNEEKNYLKLLGLDFYKKSLFLYTETNATRLSLLDHLDTSQEEELKMNLRKVFRKNIAALNPLIFFSDKDKFYIFSYGNPKIYRLRDWNFFMRKDRDLMSLNDQYNTSLMTNQIAQSRISSVRKDFPFIYSAAYFFQGLAIGNPLSWGHGWGRWNYILGSNITSYIKDKKILDLGSNLGILPLYMLRAGASEVKGFELGIKEAKTCPIYKEIMEWRDDRCYKFDVVNSSMIDVITEENKHYDVVTAFCSLYYLDEEEITNLFEWILDNIGIMIIQSNEDSDVSQRQDLAKLNYLIGKAEKVGFKIIQRSMGAHKDYPRPLFVAVRPG